MAESGIAGIQIPDSLLIDQRSNRPVFVFDVPAKSVDEVGITSLGIVELTMDEERQVMSTMKGTSIGAAAAVQYSLVMASLHEINGTRLQPIGESRDVAISALRPLARALATKAYQSLHNPTKDLEKDFLKGRRVVAK